MLGSISPVGEAGRGQRWWLTATAYVLGSLGAGAAVGALAGAAGSVLVGSVAPTDRVAALAAAVATAALLDVLAPDGRIPSWHRQVDERWLGTYRGWVYGLGFGAQLGLGVATIVNSASLYAALAAATLAASWRAGLVVGAVFGVMRALPLIAMAPVRAPARLHAVTRRVAAAEALAHRATVAALAVLAGGLLAAVVAS